MGALPFLFISPLITISILKSQFSILKSQFSNLKSPSPYHIHFILWQCNALNQFSLGVVDI